MVVSQFESGTSSAATAVLPNIRRTRRAGRHEPAGEKVLIWTGLGHGSQAAPLGRNNTDVRPYHISRIRWLTLCVAYFSQGDRCRPWEPRSHRSRSSGRFTIT
jgi:hypothetical protein